MLFQVTNVIYLVSAAWFPWAMICILQMVQTKHLKWALGLAMVCAMMILGGDPQMVYHVGLISAVTLGVRCVQTHKSLDLERRLGWWRGLILMAVLVATTSVLSASSVAADDGVVAVERAFKHTSSLEVFTRQLEVDLTQTGSRVGRPVDF